MKVDQIIQVTLSIFNAAGEKVAGRAGTVTTNLQMDNAATGEAVTVAESSDAAGDYQASFTPLATGTYRLDVYDATYNPQGWFGSWEVLGSDDDSITADLVTVQADVAFIKSIEGGRWRITENQMLFYASDNVTEVARFNLLDSGGSPVMTNVMERTRV